MEDNIDFLNSIVNGILNEEFSIVYQPIFELEKQKIVSVESLVRWNKCGKEIGANVFISKLEEAKLIYLLDYYVLDKVMMVINQWELQNIRIVPVSINISKSTILRSDFIEILKSKIKEYKINSNYIVLELTERENIEENMEEFCNVIKEIRKLGVRISIDDFGVGTANILLLSNINFDYLKVDKFLIDNIYNDEKVKIFLEAINKIVKISNAHAIMEGIETKQQLQTVINYGYKYGQGYYLSRPKSVEKLENVLTLNTLKNN